MAGIKAATASIPLPIELAAGDQFKPSCNRRISVR